MKESKEYIVIGVGSYGESVIKTLSNLGVSLLVIDRNSKKLEKIQDIVTKAMCADATNKEVLEQLGVKNFDGVIVAMGSEFQSSVLTTIQLKDLGAKYILVKATDDLAGRIYKRVGADKVVFPDRDMGIRTANQLINGNYFDAIELSEEYSIVDIPVPKNWVGKTLLELNVRNTYGLNILGIRKNNGLNINPDPHEKMSDDETLVVLGENRMIKALVDN